MQDSFHLTVPVLTQGHDAPWKNEPDELHWADEKTGLQCSILRIPHSGHLCGYVKVPVGHPLHGTSYSDDLPESLQPLMESVMEGTVGKRAPMDVFGMAAGLRHIGHLFDVHGGITYSGDLKDDGDHWYGFDCAHCDDLCPQLSDWHLDMAAKVAAAHPLDGAKCERGPLTFPTEITQAEWDAVDRALNLGKNAAWHRANDARAIALDLQMADCERGAE